MLVTLSIVILTWNDREVLKDAIESILQACRHTPFEIIISDNGSTDGTLEMLRQRFPNAPLQRIENRRNLGFARGNNAGIALAHGAYVLILNPDTRIAPGALDAWIAFADAHPEAGAFGARILNPDGSYQVSAHPFPTLRRYWLVALGLHALGRLSPRFHARDYQDWQGDTIRSIDWQSGCALLVRAPLLKKLGGFDPRFFYHFEEVDLCRRIHDASWRILFAPHVHITHLGGQSVGRAPLRFALETLRSRYRYFHKIGGLKAARACRRVGLVHSGLRAIAYGIAAPLSGRSTLRERATRFATEFRWHRRLDPERFIQYGEEPDLGYAPLAPAPTLTPAQENLPS